MYTSPDDPTSIRHFCGFCGTPLAYWSENPREESEFISLTLGTLREHDLRDLEELGVVPEDAATELEPTETTEITTLTDLGSGVPWFESMVSGSRLGTMQRSSGRRRGNNWSIEWEITEWTEDGAPAASPLPESTSESADKTAGKRKPDDSVESEVVKRGSNDQRG